MSQSHIGGAAVPIILARGQTGVALFELEPAWTADLVEQFRRQLDIGGFTAAFPGYLPVIHRRLRLDDIPHLDVILDEGFAFQDPAGLPSDGLWCQALQLVLAPPVAAPALPAPPPARHTTLRRAGLPGLAMAGVAACFLLPPLWPGRGADPPALAAPSAQIVEEPPSVIAAPVLPASVAEAPEPLAAAVETALSGLLPAAPVPDGPFMGEDRPATPPPIAVAALPEAADPISSAEPASDLILRQPVLPRPDAEPLAGLMAALPGIPAASVAAPLIAAFTPPATAETLSAPVASILPIEPLATAVVAEPAAVEAPAASTLPIEPVATAVVTEPAAVETPATSILPTEPLATAVVAEPVVVEAPAASILPTEPLAAAVVAVPAAVETPAVTVLSTEPLATAVVAVPVVVEAPSALPAEPVATAVLAAPATVEAPPVPAASAGPPVAPAPAANPALAVPLLRRGTALLALGDISGARRFLERAAAGGSAVAASLLAETYDPHTAPGLRTRGLQPDRAAALGWYRRAAALGAAVGPAIALLETAP